jgi:hypothetical protein
LRGVNNKKAAMEGPMDTAPTRTLRRALAACKGDARVLSQILEVSMEDIAAWLVGKRVPPTRVYLAALDVVAHGPLRRSA